MEAIKKKLKERQIVDYESDTIEQYEMLSEEFDYEKVRKSTNFRIKKYKDSLYRGEVHPETHKRQGQGVMVYDSGRLYEGTWKVDKRHGKGFEAFASGNTYQGEYKNGKADGKGIYCWANGESYQGLFSKGMKQGHGVWKGTKNDSYIGAWVANRAEGYGVHSWMEGDRYEGEWKACLREGYGTDFFRGGDQYTGQYAAGLPQGYGQYEWANGDVYSGDFERGRKHGKGKWRQRAADPAEPHKINQYEGEYKDDEKHGFGCFTWEMGNKYTGNFKQDLRDGWGTMEWIDGSVYKGQWANGIQQGFGIMIYNTDLATRDRENAAGKVRAGFFENNVFTKPLHRFEDIKTNAGLEEADLDDDVYDEIKNYLRNREKKAKALAKKRGVKAESIMESMLESEEEDVGQELKTAIVDVKEQNKPEWSNADQDKGLIYDVKEEKMQSFKGMEYQAGAAEGTQIADEQLLLKKISESRDNDIEVIEKSLKADTSLVHSGAAEMRSKDLSPDRGSLPPLIQAQTPIVPGTAEVVNRP